MNIDHPPHPPTVPVCCGCHVCFPCNISLRVCVCWCVFTQLWCHVLLSQLPVPFTRYSDSYAEIPSPAGRRQTACQRARNAPPASRSSSVWNSLALNRLQNDNPGKSQQTGISPLKHAAGMCPPPSLCCRGRWLFSAPAACDGNAAILWSVHRITFLQGIVGNGPGGGICWLSSIIGVNVTFA